MAIYPFYTAGQRLTAANLQAGQFAVASKTAHTDRASNTTPADDPELTFQLAANAIYTVEFYLNIASVTGGLVQTLWTVPSGATGNRTVFGPGQAATDTSANNISMRSGVHAYSTSIVYGTRNSIGAQFFAMETSLVTTTSAGTCAIKWAQSVSNATATRMAQGSWARALRIQ